MRPVMKMMTAPLVLGWLSRVSIWGETFSNGKLYPKYKAKDSRRRADGSTASFSEISAGPWNFWPSKVSIDCGCYIKDSIE